jgi:hypothetical protein
MYACSCLYREGMLASCCIDRESMYACSCLYREGMLASCCIDRESIYTCFLAVVCLVSSFLLYRQRERVYMLAVICLLPCLEKRFQQTNDASHVLAQGPRMLCMSPNYLLCSLLLVHDTAKIPIRSFTSLFCVYTIGFDKQMMLLTSSLRGLECPV